jgi:hypothetical protein
MESAVVIKRFVRSFLSDAAACLREVKFMENKSNYSLFLILWARHELNAFSLVKIGFDPTPRRMLKEIERL